MYQKINKFKLKNLLLLIILIILSVLPTISLFHPGLPITHDGQDHVARIANFYQNLVDGVIFPHWAANLNWGFGHPILEFLYPFPSYLASFFHFVGFGLVDSTKIVLGLGMILSFLFTYLWLSQFSNKYASIFGAFLYTYAPYRFVDLYVRGDIGENLAFAFIPLVMLFIFRIYKKISFNDVIFGGIALALLILSHNAIALMALPFILIYCAYLIYVSKKQKLLIINLSFLILLGFLFSAFFWVPALIEAKYTLRNIVTKDSFVGRFINIQQLIYGSWNYGQSGQFTVQLGLLQWISLILSPFIGIKLFKNKNKEYLWVLGILVLCLAGIFLMLQPSIFFWDKIILLANFQFPWRFLAVTVIATSILGVFTFSLIPKKFQAYVLIISIILVLFLQKDYFSPKGYQYKPKSYYSGIYYSTTDTGESSPVWSIRFMEHTPKANLEMLDGKADIKQLERTTVDHKYKVEVYKRTLFEENTLYFPGWEIKANGVRQVVQFQNMQYRGVMLFFLERGSYIVDVSYKDTKVRLFSELISILTFLSIFLFVALRFIKKRIY